MLRGLSSRGTSVGAVATTNRRRVKMESQMCEIIARACHEVNRSYCEMVGDNSQVRWDDAPE